MELDVLRGLAILSAVMAHIGTQWKNTPSAAGAPPPQLPLTIPLLNVNVLDLFVPSSAGYWSLGTLGLFLFFLMSGYLLAWSEDGRMRREGAYSVRSFTLRRALRILPAYYVAIAIIVAGGRAIAPSFGIVVGSNIPSFGDVLLTISFLWVFLEPLQANTLDPILWSLPFEVICYCLLPFVVVKLPRLSQRCALLALLFVLFSGGQMYIGRSGLGDEALEAGIPNLLSLAQIPLFLFLFVAGVLLRMMVEHLEDNLSRVWWRPLVASGLLLGSILWYVIHPGLYVIYPPLHILAHASVATIAFFASALLGTPLLRGVLRWKPLAFVGVISYSMFLLHGTVLSLTMYILQPIRAWAASERSALAVWAVFSSYALGALVVISVVSYLSYRYVESPFLRRKPT